MDPERLELGGEDYRSIRFAGVVERFFAEPIASQQQSLLRVVPNRECEHSVESMKGVDAPFLVGLEDDFGVAYSTNLRRVTSNYYSSAPAAGQAITATYRYN